MPSVVLTGSEVHTLTDGKEELTVGIAKLIVTFSSLSSDGFENNLVTQKQIYVHTLCGVH
jgi:hypothetical protein